MKTNTNTGHEIENDEEYIYMKIPEFQNEYNSNHIKLFFENQNHSKYNRWKLNEIIYQKQLNHTSSYDYLDKIHVGVFNMFHKMISIGNDSEDKIYVSKIIRGQERIYEFEGEKYYSTVLLLKPPNHYTHQHHIYPMDKIYIYSTKNKEDETIQFEQRMVCEEIEMDMYEEEREKRYIGIKIKTKSQYRIQFSNIIHTNDDIQDYSLLFYIPSPHSIHEEMVVEIPILDSKEDILFVDFEKYNQIKQKVSNDSTVTIWKIGFIRKRNEGYVVDDKNKLHYFEGYYVLSVGDCTSQNQLKKNIYNPWFIEIDYPYEKIINENICEDDYFIIQKNKQWSIDFEVTCL
jgi:hypothetical protein